MTSRAEEYKRYARQRLEIASTFQDEEARATLIGQARAWLRLAHLAHANRHIPLLKPRAAHYHTVAQEDRCASQQKLRDDVADGSNRSLADVRCMTAFLPRTDIRRHA